MIDSYSSGYPVSRVHSKIEFRTLTKKVLPLRRSAGEITKKKEEVKKIVTSATPGDILISIT